MTGRTRKCLTGCSLLAFLLPVLLVAAGWLTFLFGPNEDQRQVRDAIKQAVKKDPGRINAPYQDGKPPLHLALEHHLPGLFQWLLAHGADPNARDERGQTAVHEAVYYEEDHHRALRMLLRHNGEINAKTDSGKTPLHLAVSASRVSTVELLLSLGADPTLPDSQGKTPLHEAASPQPTAIPEDVERIIHLLATGGVDLNARARNGDSPLHIAALTGNVVVTRALLKEGALVDQSGCGGCTALHQACVFGRVEVAEILLQAGADPNRRDDTALTPLDRALRYPATGSEPPGPVDTTQVIDLLRRFGATS